MSYLKKYFQKVPEERRETAAIAYLAALDHVTHADAQVGKLSCHFQEKEIIQRKLSYLVADQP